MGPTDDYGMGGFGMNGGNNPYDAGALAVVKTGRGTVTARNKVACEPFPDMAVKTSAVGTGTVKVGRIDNTAKGSMVTLRVIFGSEDDRFRAGQRVMLQANLYSQPWASSVQELHGQQFILVPADAVEVITDE